MSKKVRDGRTLNLLNNYLYGVFLHALSTQFSLDSESVLIPAVKVKEPKTKYLSRTGYLF